MRSKLLIIFATFFPSLVLGLEGIEGSYIKNKSWMNDSKSIIYLSTRCGGVTSYVMKRQVKKYNDYETSGKFFFAFSMFYHVGKKYINNEDVIRGKLKYWIEQYESEDNTNGSNVINSDIEICSLKLYDDFVEIKKRTE